MPCSPGAAGFFTEAFMNNLNSVLIEGNMVRDPLMRSTSKGTAVCNFTIASNRYYKQDSDFEKEVGFFDVEAWGKLGDLCGNLGKKGRGVRVVGRLKYNHWTGNDGKSHNRVAIVAEHVEYRPDFKKAKESSDEAEELAETSLVSEDNADSGDVFAGLPKEVALVEEAEAITF